MTVKHQRYHKSSIWDALPRAIGITLAVLFLTAMLTLGMGLWALPLLAVMLGVTLYRARRHEALNVLQYIDQAMRSRLPLPRSLEAAAHDEKPGTAMALLRIGDALSGGESLHAALARWVPMMPARPMMMITVGERTGRLAEAVRRATAGWRHFERTRHAEGGFALGYAVTIGGAICILLGGFMTVIYPKLIEIFRDFGQPMPFEVPGWVLGPTLMLVGITGAIAVPFIVLAGSQIVGGRWDLAWRWLLDPVTWLTPGMHGWQRNRALGDGLTMMADLTGAGMPAPQAAYEVSHLHMNRAMSNRFRKWSRMLLDGIEPGAAAKGAGLPAMVYGLLGTRGARADLPETLRFLGGYYGSRADRNAEWFRAAVVPVMVLTLAGVVGVLAYLFVGAMAELIVIVADSADLGGYTP